MAEKKPEAPAVPLPDPGIRPLAGRVLVQRCPPEATTKGGIVIPDSGKEKSRRAVVLARGPAPRDARGNTVPWDVNVGDTVLMNAYAGAEIQYDGKDYVLVEAADLLAVLPRRA